MIFDWDKYILVQVQRFAHWSQRTTGLGASHLTVWAYLIGMCFAAKDKIWLAVCICLLEAFLSARKMDSWPTKDVMDYSGWIGFWRLFTLAVNIIVFPQDIQRMDLWGEFFVLGWYLRDCHNLPEDKSKLRQGLDDMTTVFQPQGHLT